MTPRFVHLHLHSEYSLIDSTIRIDDLCARCAQLQLPAVALTDQSNLFALIKFCKAAEAQGIKPLAGADLWLSEPGAPPSRLTVLCRNRNGYLGLSRLLSRAWLHGHQGDKICVQPQWLYAERHDLFVLAGRDSLIGRHLAAGRIEAAQQVVREWSDWFPDALYLELTRTGRDGEQTFNDAALALADTFDLPLLATNDVRFLNPDDFAAHEARVCIASGRVVDDPKRPREYSREQYLKSPEQMVELFADLPDALENTVALAQRCNLELQLGTYFLPDFPVPAGYDAASWLREQARQGLEARLRRHPLAPGRSRADYEARLANELEVIVGMGFSGYFLIVADFINWAKQKDIPVGPGRGSGAGSLVAWALGITDLDPLPYDLLFERFLNPERVSMPDFDIDFCMDGRDKVIAYVADKYGCDKVSQIITFGTMAAKAVLRDTGRVLGHPYGFVDSIAKLIPNTLGSISLADALGESDKARKDPSLASPELIARYQSEEEVRELIDLARQLEGLARNAGRHAGGVVIAPTPLTDFCPLYCEHGEQGSVTQFDKDDVESVGLVKFDFLGLRTLTILDWAVRAIHAERNERGEAAIDLSTLSLDDPKVYELFQRGDTVAVFQFESRGMRELLKRARPDRFEDLIALAALFRPGPLGSGMDKDWTARKHGEAEVTYPHPLLEPVLAPTYGVIVYQEQVMQIAQVLAGYSLGGADLLRRAMGKKKPEEMAKERAKFERGAAANGIEPRIASSIFDLMEKFAEYGFNKSHSAAYALIAYQTAWLKVHYPAAFMAATLTSDMDNTDKVVVFLNEARSLGLLIEPPDVNHSAWGFTAVRTDRIRYGLGAIKGVGRSVCEAIVEARASGPFRDLPDFCRRVGNERVNKRALEALIQAGALDSLGSNRPSLLAQLPDVLRATEQVARAREAGQVSLFATADSDPVLGKLPQIEDWPLRRKLDGEREMLGHYLSGHPIDPWRSELHALTGFHLGEIERIYHERRERRREVPVVVAGIVNAVRKRGESTAFVQIDDGRGTLELNFFRDAFTHFGELLTRDRVLIAEGALSEDDFDGGYVVRVRRCWDFQALCEMSTALELDIDLRIADALIRLEQVFSAWRPGSTALHMRVTTPVGRGRIEINGANAVRCAPDLLDALRAVPGVRAVHPVLHRPWQANT